MPRFKQRIPLRGWMILMVAGVLLIVVVAEIATGQNKIAGPGPLFIPLFFATPILLIWGIAQTIVDAVRARRARRVNDTQLS